MKMDMPDLRSVANAEEALQVAFRMGVLGIWPRVLCVCAAAINRSPTTAWVLAKAPYECRAISVGSDVNKALVPINQQVLNWAQHVVFADRKTYDAVSNLPMKVSGEIYVLDVPDRFSYRDPELIQLIEKELKSANFPRSN